MNFLSLGLRTLKVAERARATAVRTNERAQEVGLPAVCDPDEAYQYAVDAEHARLERAFDIGLTYYAMAKRKMAKEPNERWYMLTVRPPPGTNIKTLVHTTETFVNAWKADWQEYEYCYEQKGETEADMGKGCHVHMLIRTDKANYYPSHILRDAKRAWPYVAANCIQVDTLVNVPKAKAYVRGTKNHADKEASAALDPVWRAREGLLELYESGQVHPLSIK